MWGALLTFEKDEQLLLGVAREIPILYFYKKRTRKVSLRYNGETNGVPTLYCLMETLILVGLLSFSRKGLIEHSHPLIYHHFPLAMAARYFVWTQRNQGIIIYYLLARKPNYLMQSLFFIEISTYQKSNYNKPFCFHIKLLLNLKSELFSIKFLIESFIQMTSSTKLALFHTKTVLLLKVKLKL